MRWEIFVIQNSHIDVGYTDRQEAIADQHRQFIGQAVRLAHSRAQAGRSKDTRFRFTCEGFWAIEQFLKSATPAAKRALISAFRSGDLELTAFRFHLTELLDEGHMLDSIRPSLDFARRHRLPLKAALSVDINGLPWAWVDLLAGNGIRYLATSINLHHGGYPLGGPCRPFWWESRQGNRILVWNGYQYHKANLIGLMGGYGCRGGLGVPHTDNDEPNVNCDVQDLSLAEMNIARVLKSLERDKYPHRVFALLGSGLNTDNSPPSDRVCGMIEQWNRRHGQRVRIRTATLGEFFAKLEREGGKNIPVHRGEWPDWWGDGVASAPRDTLVFRNAQRQKRLLEKLDPQATVFTPRERAAAAGALALYAEHTFGHSSPETGTLLANQVFARKSAMAANADQLVGEATMRVMHARGEGAFTARRPFRWIVRNPSERRKTAPAALLMDWWEDFLYTRPLVVRDQRGRSYPAQLEPVPRGALLHVVLNLEGGEARELSVEFDEEGPSKPGAPRKTTTVDFANDYYRLRGDSRHGFTSWKPRGGAEIVASGQALAEPIYQIFPGANRWNAGGFQLRTRVIPEGKIQRGKITRLQTNYAGPIFQEWELQHKIAGAKRCAVRFRAWTALPRVDISMVLLKDPVEDPDGFYLAFPLRLPGSEWHLDRPGGSMRPGRDQLPSTCCDYYMVQEGAALCGRSGGVAWSSPDAPMVHLGGLNLWKYRTRLAPGGTLYSWVTNNKWETNFVRVHGELCEFRYQLRFEKSFRNAQTAIAAVQETALPFVALRR